MIGVLSGCDRNGKLFKLQDEVHRQDAQLYKGYLVSDVRGARTNLLVAADLFEKSSFLEPVGRTELLFQTYLRLYVLEKRVGNDALAEANLIKAKYWMLRSGELKKNDPEAVGKYVSQLTPEHIFEDVDTFDKRRNNGNYPAYMSKLGTLTNSVAVP